MVPTSLVFVQIAQHRIDLIPVFDGFIFHKRKIWNFV